MHSRLKLSSPRPTAHNKKDWQDTKLED